MGDEQEAADERGGGNRQNFNANSFHNNVSNNSVNRNTNVNRNANANVNRNTNVNVNRNANVNVNHGYNAGCCNNYDSGPGWGGVAAGVAVGAVVGAAAASTVPPPPPYYPPGTVYISSVPNGVVQSVMNRWASRRGQPPPVERRCDAGPCRVGSGPFHRREQRSAGRTAWGPEPFSATP